MRNENRGHTQPRSFSRLTKTPSAITTHACVPKGTFQNVGVNRFFQDKKEVVMARKLIDLTQEIYNGMPVYPGHQRTVIFDVKTHEETKETNKPGTHTSIVMGLLMCDHGPTHVDAFIHIDS